MTRDEAEAIIARIASLEFALVWSTHARERAGARRFTLADVLAVLRTHVTENAPSWNEKHSRYRVSLRGRCMNGRPTRIILDLDADGHSTLVSIMVAHRIGRRR